MRAYRHKRAVIRERLCFHPRAYPLIAIDGSNAYSAFGSQPSARSKRSPVPHFPEFGFAAHFVVTDPVIVIARRPIDGDARVARLVSRRVTTRQGRSRNPVVTPTGPIREIQVDQLTRRLSLITKPLASVGPLTEVAGLPESIDKYFSFGRRPRG